MSEREDDMRNDLKHGHNHDDCDFCNRRSLAQAMKANGLSTNPDDWRDSQGLGRAIIEKLEGR